MLTRRELLLSVGAFGLPVRYPAQGSTRFGALQSRSPFMDEQDLPGSRARAFAAFRVLLQRSVQRYGPFDWLAAGALPLSGPGPFGSPRQIALHSHSEEVQWLTAFAHSQRMQLTLGAWWSATGHEVAPRLLVFDRDGELRVSPRRALHAVAGLGLELPERPELRYADLTALCRQRRSYGVRIETLAGPPVPPGAMPFAGSGSFIVGPDGRAVAAADRYAEACLVAMI